MSTHNSIAPQSCGNATLTAARHFCLLLLLCLLYACGGDAQPEEPADQAMLEPDFQLYHDQITSIIPTEVLEEAASDITWQIFYDLFTPETQPMVRVVFSEWLGVPLTALDLSPDGKAMEQAFAGTPYEDYMKAIIALSRTPSARLQYLLTAMDLAANDWLRDGTVEAWRQKGADNRSELLKQHIAGLLEQAGPGVYSDPEERREGVLPGDAPASANPDGDSITESSLYISGGIGDGPKLFFREEFHSSSGVEWLNYSIAREDTHLMKQTSGNAWWGHSIVQIVNTNEGISYRTAYCITQVENGRIAIITPDQPDRSEFFRDPREGWGRLVENSKEQRCSNSQVFSFNDDTLDLRAEYRPYQFPRGSSSLGVCTPECDIPYVWDGQIFVRQEKICRPQGAWGYKPQ